MKRFAVFVVLVSGLLLGSPTAGAPPGFGGLLVAGVVSVCVAGAPQQAPQAVPLSPLPLQLLAVVVNKTTPAKSVCLIRCAYPAEKQGTFSTGQRVCDLADIKEIRGDGVIVTNLLSERLERLPFSNAQPVPDAQPASDRSTRTSRSTAPTSTIRCRATSAAATTPRSSFPRPRSASSGSCAAAPAPKSGERGRGLSMWSRNGARTLPVGRRSTSTAIPT